MNLNPYWTDTQPGECCATCARLTELEDGGARYCGIARLTYEDAVFDPGEMRCTAYERSEEND